MGIEIDPESWTSFDLFEEKKKRFAQPEPQKEEKKEEQEKASEVSPPSVSEVKPDGNDEAVTDRKQFFSILPARQREEIAVTQPERVLNLPSLPPAPAAQQTFDVMISSTEEDKEKEERLKPVIVDGAAKITLPEKDWRSVEEATAKTQAAQQDKFSIRYAGLPDRSISPVEKPVRVKKKKQPPPAQQPKAEKKAAAPVCDTSAVEALREQKRRQLQAMESDRKTLAALQEAIEALGASDKLNFLSGVSGPLMTAAPQQKETPVAPVEDIAVSAP